MSSVSLFLEINRLRLKIDERMQLELWPRLFPLLCADDASDINIEIPTSVLIQFLTMVARKSQNAFVNTNASMASQYAAAASSSTQQPPPPPPSDIPAFSAGGGGEAAPRTVFNLFARTEQQQQQQQQPSSNELINMRQYRNAARKLVHHYTLNSTNSTEYKISDVIMTMIFLLRSEKYHYLFKLLESTFHDYTCKPQMTQVQVDTLLDSLRSLLEMPSIIIDMNTVDVMRSSFARCFNSPVMRYAKVVLLQNLSFQRDQRTTLEELLVERGERIQSLQPQQYINSGTEIPFCNDVEFINKLLKHIHPYSLPRMYYNAANTMFYTTMENYAVSNCKFNIEDYNNIFRVMNKIKQCSRSAVNKTNNIASDDLNIYLGIKSAEESSNALVKRKKY